MELVSEPLPGVKILRPFVHQDERGDFVKTFHKGQLIEHGISMTVREEFYTISAGNTIRGMHFQSPPHAHQKIIYCTAGRVLDVLLDIRRSSPCYGQHASVELSADHPLLVCLPVGIAHGFISLEDRSCLVYKTDAVYAPEADLGIRYNSFGFIWPDLGGTPLLSLRDREHPNFPDFASPL